MTVSIEQREKITIVTINRPAVRNAVDGPTAALLAAAFREFDADDSQSVAILTGAEGTFCAGVVLKAVATGNGNRMRESGDGPMGPSRMLLSKPVIASASCNRFWMTKRAIAPRARLAKKLTIFGVPALSSMKTGVTTRSLSAL